MSVTHTKDGECVMLTSFKSDSFRAGRAVSPAPKMEERLQAALRSAQQSVESAEAKTAASSRKLVAAEQANEALKKELAEAQAALEIEQQARTGRSGILHTVESCILLSVAPPPSGTQPPQQPAR